MCLKNKIIAVTLCALAASIGITGIQAGVANAQSTIGATVSSSLSIEQLQQTVLNLQNQIAQILQLIAQKQATTCAQNGETITTSGKKCCAGLTAIAPAGCTAASGCVADSWVCQKPQTQTQACADICKGQDYAGSQCNTYAISLAGLANQCAAGYVNSNISASDCAVASNIVGSGKACCCQEQKTCAKTGEIFSDSARQCCAGSTRTAVTAPCATPINTSTAGTGTAACSGTIEYTCTSTAIPVCGNGTCESSETVKNCPADCAPTICSVDSDCVSDSGTCHKCFNKTWWVAQSSSVKTKWICDGIGNALCKCQSGTCAVASICGNFVCDTAKGETATNCPADCASTSCKAEGSTCNTTYINGTTSSAQNASTLNCCAGMVCKYANNVGTCVKISTCGNGICEAGETATGCPQDCCKPQVNEQISMLQGQLAALNAQSLQNSSATTGKQLAEQIATLQSQLSSLMTSCTNTSVCGNGQCEVGETATTCPADCKSSACIPAGYELTSGQNCCAGLSSLVEKYSQLTENWTCLPMPNPRSLCAKCGDGICGPGESYCSCPQDCCTPGTVSGCKVCQTNPSQVWKDDNSKCTSGQVCKAGACISSSCGNGVCESSETTTGCPADCATSANFIPVSIVTSSTQPVGSAPATLTNTFNIQVTATNGDVYMPNAGAFTVAVLKDSETDATKYHIGSIYSQPSGTVLVGSSYKIPQNTTATFSATATDSTTVAGNYHLQMAIISWSTLNGGAYTNWVPAIPSIWAGQTVYLQGSNTPVCGNGICESNETAANCPADCGGSTCVTEGNTTGISPSAAKCCSGLTANSVFAVCSDATQSSTGLSSAPIKIPSYGVSVCTKCGDGICGPGENKCNCPTDCNTTSCKAEGLICNTTYINGTTNSAQNTSTFNCCAGMVCKYANNVGTCVKISACGNGVCEAGETNANCAKDCPATTCSSTLTSDACAKAGGQMLCSAYSALCLTPIMSGSSAPTNCGSNGTSSCYCQCGSPVVGGNCTYKTFPGKCTITSLVPDSAGFITGNYTFVPSATVDITGTFLKSPNDINPYNGNTAASGFTPGMVAACNLNVITGGTCTPINVSFPTIPTTTIGGSSSPINKTSSLPFSLDSISASLSQIIAQLNALLGK